MNWFGIKQFVKLHLPRFCNERAIDWWLRDVRKGAVISGPFAGTRYIAESYGSSLYPKLLGTYEKELADLWQPGFVQSFDTIINIGCAEGYYLAGLGRISRQDEGKNVALLGYDLSEKAIKLCRRLLEQNGLHAKSLVAGPFDGAGLDDGKVLVICDIEGAEESVMDPMLWPELAAAFLVIEIHDKPTSTNLITLIKSRFKSSHTIQEIHFAEREEADFPPIIWPWFSSKVKKQMVDEGRLYGKDWLILRPNAPTDS
ncbi:MAG: class I SAM-dependent methyltransferase [Puniceicoccaceae bacterium]|nr:MAG: class I SAM-dependent methyltransferase [Puniceicoccaceae bacterium]